MCDTVKLWKLCSSLGAGAGERQLQMQEVVYLLCYYTAERERDRRRTTIETNLHAEEAFSSFLTLWLSGVSSYSGVNTTFIS